jgi:hypothetical protein
VDIGVMKMEMTITNNQIAKRAMEDSEFRRDLLKAPREAIKKFFGIDVGEEYKINVVEQEENECYIVLPKAPEDDNKAKIMWQ